MVECAIMAGGPMESFLIHETFKGGNLHRSLEWLNPPASWRVDTARSRLLVEPSAATDFWQRTHYGFRADSGHFLHAEVVGDGELAVTVLAMPAHQFDQAGLMVRLSADCWLKTSVEYEPDGPSQLGVVVTNNGFSDWSLQDFTGAGTLSYSLRVRWEGDDFFVEHRTDENGPWHLLRVAHLFRKAGLPWRCGIYACSPQGSGFQAEFSDLRIEAA
jgi:regulation of enolase protein 1 (concanavalin A-like superfamily)